LAPHDRAALMHLKKFAPLYGVGEGALNTASVTQIHDLGHGGIIRAMRQSGGGIGVFRGGFKGVMRRGHDAVAISGAPNPFAVTGPDKAKINKWKVTPQQALVSAVNDLYETKLTPVSVLDMKTNIANYQYYDFLPTPAVKATNLYMGQPARVK